MEKIQQWSRKRPIFGLQKSSDLEDFLSIDIDCGAHKILNLDSSNSAWTVLQYLHCSVSVPDSYRVARVAPLKCYHSHLHFMFAMLFVEGYFWLLRATFQNLKLEPRLKQFNAG